MNQELKVTLAEGMIIRCRTKQMVIALDKRLGNIRNSNEITELWDKYTSFTCLGLTVDSNRLKIGYVCGCKDPYLKGKKVVDFEDLLMGESSKN